MKSHKFYEFILYIIVPEIAQNKNDINRKQKQQQQQNCNINSDNDVVVVYNRVPKTGSTSFVGIGYDLCKRNKFHVLHVNITSNNHVLSLPNQYDIVQNITNWNEVKPALYHGHFAFLDFSK